MEGVFFNGLIFIEECAFFIGAKSGAVRDFDNSADVIRAGVTELCEKFPLYV